AGFSWSGLLPRRRLESRTIPAGGKEDRPATDRTKETPHAHEDCSPNTTTSGWRDMLRKEPHDEGCTYPARPARSPAAPAGPHTLLRTPSRSGNDPEPDAGGLCSRHRRRVADHLWPYLL